MQCIDVESNIEKDRSENVWEDLINVCPKITSKEKWKIDTNTKG